MRHWQGTVPVSVRTTAVWPGRRRCHGPSRSVPPPGRRCGARHCEPLRPSRGRDRELEIEARRPAATAVNPASHAEPPRAGSRRESRSAQPAARRPSRRQPGPAAADPGPRGQAVIPGRRFIPTRERRSLTRGPSQATRSQRAPSASSAVVAHDGPSGPHHGPGPVGPGHTGCFRGCRD